MNQFIDIRRGLGVFSDRSAKSLNKDVYYVKVSRFFMRVSFANTQIKIRWRGWSEFVYIDIKSWNGTPIDQYRRRFAILTLLLPFNMQIRMDFHLDFTYFPEFVFHKLFKVWPNTSTSLFFFLFAKVCIMPHDKSLISRVDLDVDNVESIQQVTVDVEHYLRWR